MGDVGDRRRAGLHYLNLSNSEATYTSQLFESCLVQDVWHLGNYSNPPFIPQVGNIRGFTEQVNYPLHQRAKNRHMQTIDPQP
jgi:hypothetical protein